MTTVTNHRIRTPILLLATLCAPTATLAADELVVEPVPFDGHDLADATGLDIYKFKVLLLKGQTVAVTLDVMPDAAARPVNYLYRQVKAAQEGEASLVVSFLREDRKLASALLSEEKRMDVRIQWRGVANDGLNGNISKPLADIPNGSKALLVHKRPKKLPDGSSELLLLFHTQPTAGAPLPALYPQASLRIKPVE